MARLLRHFLGEAKFPWDQFTGKNKYKPPHGEWGAAPKGTAGKTDADYGITSGDSDDLDERVMHLINFLFRENVTVVGYGQRVSRMQIRDQYGEDALRAIIDHDIIDKDTGRMNADRAREVLRMGKLPESVVREAPGDDEDEPPKRPLGADPFAQRAVGTIKQTSKPIGSMSVTAQKPQASAPAPASQMTWDKEGDVPRPGLPAQKPLYPGKFVGQVAKMGRQRVDKKVAWTDKTTNPAQKRYGRVKGWGEWDQWVWDGKDWVRPGGWDAKFPSTGKKESVWREAHAARTSEGPIDKLKNWWADRDVSGIMPRWDDFSHHNERERQRVAQLGHERQQQRARDDAEMTAQQRLGQPQYQPQSQQPATSPPPLAASSPPPQKPQKLRATAAGPRPPRQGKVKGP